MKHILMKEVVAMYLGEMSERELQNKIQYFEDLLLRSKNFNEQLKFHDMLTKMRKQASLLKMNQMKRGSC